MEVWSEYFWKCVPGRWAMGGSAHAGSSPWQAEVLLLWVELVLALDALEVEGHVPMAQAGGSLGDDVRDSRGIPEPGLPFMGVSRLR